MRTRCVASALLLLCGGVRSGHAQSADRLSSAVGHRVRVRAGSPDDVTTGTLSVITDSTIALRAPSGATVIPWRTIVTIDVSRGHNRIGDGVMYGLFGGAAGIVVGAVLGAATTSKDDELRGLSIAVAGGLGGIVGLTSGTIYGALSAPERWRPVFPNP